MKLKLEETDKTAEFSDNDEISDYALDAVYAMQSNGIKDSCRNKYGNQNGNAGGIFSD